MGLTVGRLSWREVNIVGGELHPKSRERRGSPDPPYLDPYLQTYLYYAFPSSFYLCSYVGEVGTT